MVAPGQDIVLVLSQEQAGAVCIALTGGVLFSLAAAGEASVDVCIAVAEVVGQLNEAIGNEVPEGYRVLVRALQAQKAAQG